MSSIPAGARVAVVGSINMDVVNRVQRFPRPGETVFARHTTYHAGGKGANQAVASALAGATVTMIGALGTDPFAHTLRDSLRARGVQTDAVLEKPVASGQATITVDDTGQNMIVLTAGANGLLMPEDVERYAEVITSAQILLVQNEVPWETTRTAIALANTAGIRVVVNPAPAVPLPDDIYPLINTLVMNEHEAAILCDRSSITRDKAEAVAHDLLTRGVREVVLTLGAAGVVFASAHEDHVLVVPSYAVEVTDTTGAGDTFIGAYAATVQSMPAEEALRFASAAAAIAITRPGAQEAMPTRLEIERFLAAH